MKLGEPGNEKTVPLEGTASHGQMVPSLYPWGKFLFKIGSGFQGAPVVCLYVPLTPKTPTNYSIWSLPSILPASRETAWAEPQEAMDSPVQTYLALLGLTSSPVLGSISLSYPLSFLAGPCHTEASLSAGSSLSPGNCLPIPRSYNWSASILPSRPRPLGNSSFPAPCLPWDLANPAEAGRGGTVPTAMALRASGCCWWRRTVLLDQSNFSPAARKLCFLQSLSLSNMGSCPCSPANCFCETAQARQIYFPLNAAGFVIRLSAS